MLSARGAGAPGGPCNRYSFNPLPSIRGTETQFKAMRIIAAMFDSRSHAEEAIERLAASHCPRDAVTFLPETELSEIASGGAYDWRVDKWDLWRGLAAFEIMSDPDRYCLAEGMRRGASVLLVAAADEDAVERYGAVLVEAGAVDLDEREKSWREAGWAGFDSITPPVREKRPGTSSRLRLY